ncbi:MAG TPA: pitrilysin family protein [Vicinamibacterales bacterium]|nr:pitrilysin family protein [Vicinamibacterales bacterium]
MRSISIRRRVGVAAAFALVAGTALHGQAPDRTKLPTPGPTPTLKLPAIQKRQLSNGLPVWIVELHEVPVAQVNLVVTSGSADDPAGKYGVANMTASMLENGAGTRSALEIADAVDFLGASLETTNGSDSSVIRLHVPVGRLGDALPIMADVALKPTFPQEELDRLKQERLTTLIQVRNDPASVVGLAFSRTVFGNSHRFGTAIMGSAATIKAMTVADLRSFYTARYRPDNATLLVVGDVTADKILPLLQTSFGSWRASGPPPPHVVLPEPAAITAREVVIVDKPGAPQSQIRIGGPGVARSTPDFFPIQVMNTVLGGAFTSRLNTNLREEHGYTYGASSAFDMRVATGPFYAAAGVQTDKTAESLTEFFKELAAIRSPVPSDELARSKNYIALRFPERFETTGDISSNLENLVVYHLPDDYYSRYIQNIQAVTAADVTRVAQKYIVPDRVKVVIVGDRQTIEPKVRALNLGTIRIMALDEIFGPN